MSKFITLISFWCILILSAGLSNAQTPNKSKISIPGSGATQVTSLSRDVMFEKFFTDKTMRFDYFHTGTSKEEHFSFDQVVSDGIWPGSKTILNDRLKLGLYFFEVADKATGAIIYSRGFASVFGEWQTTPEADKGWGTFQESLRFPWPKATVTIRLMKRDEKNIFQPIWSTGIDPQSRAVNPSDLKHSEKVDIILDNGPCDKKVDLVVLGDGYTAKEMEKFRNDVKRLTDVLLNAAFQVEEERHQHPGSGNTVGRIGCEQAASGRFPENTPIRSLRQF
jgi:hypothetical protein